MTTIKAAVFDIDGTLAMMDKKSGTYTALPGAVEALAAARAKGLPVVAYTNGTFFPPEHYYPLLADAGLHFAPGHILTPATVAARALAAKGVKRLMVLAADGTRVPVSQMGIDVVPARDGQGPVDGVLLGWTNDFGAADLEAAAQAVWAGAPVYATSIAPYFAGAKGRMLGISGAVAAALTNATGCKVTVYGKPEVAGMQIVSQITGLPPEAHVVIGDDAKLEILMGRRVGAATIGVTTGTVDRAGFNAMPEDQRAHQLVDSLTELLSQDWLA